MDEEKLKSLISSAIDERLNAFFGLRGARLDGGDLNKFLRLAAAADSADYALKNLSSSMTFNNAKDLLTYAVKNVTFPGLMLEFGVASGSTINHIASLLSSTVYGFDSFEGLPEDWRPDFKKGAFARQAPEVRANVELVTGYFDASLPSFLSRHAEEISFLHIDCDLYSSTKTVLDLCRYRLRPGTIVVFDEYFNYVGWREHEYKAFKELMMNLNSSDKISGYEYIGYVPTHQQVAVRLH